jgi:hypothetical protein
MRKQIVRAVLRDAAPVDGVRDVIEQETGRDGKLLKSLEETILNWIADSPYNSVELTSRGFPRDKR